MNSIVIHEQVVDVQLFALARELTSVARVSLEVPVEGRPVTIADVQHALMARFPRLASLGSKLLFAVGTQYADENTVVQPGEPVACFPPVSGG